MKGDKMQSVSFRNIDEFFEYLPNDELITVNYLREIVLDCIPGVVEKLSFNVPFYKRHKSICFIWPSSVLWGKTKKYNGVRIGFIKGHLLADEDNYLEKGSRKQVYIKDFMKVEDIDEQQLRLLLYQAHELDTISHK